MIGLQYSPSIFKYNTWPSIHYLPNFDRIDTKHNTIQKRDEKRNQLTAGGK